MKPCLAFRFWALLCTVWLPLLPFLLGALAGLDAVTSVRALLRHSGGADGRTLLALAADARRFLPLAGAAWSAAFAGREVDSRSGELLRSRGFGAGAVYGSGLCLFLGGLLAVSLTEQFAAFFLILSGRGPLPPGLLVRTVLLRLPLDLGMAALPGFLPLVGGGSPYPRLLGFLYGLALWRLMGSHYGLWLPGAALAGDPLALWPLAALPAAALGFGLAIRELRH